MEPYTIRKGDVFRLFSGSLITVLDIYVYYGMGRPTVTVEFHNHALDQGGKVEADEFVAQLVNNNAERQVGGEWVEIGRGEG
jgi:hypothetical protein